MQSLFKPGSKINQDHKHKYIHILAYAASVVETWKKVDESDAKSCGVTSKRVQACDLIQTNNLLVCVQPPEQTRQHQ